MRLPSGLVRKLKIWLMDAPMTGMIIFHLHISVVKIAFELGYKTMMHSPLTSQFRTFNKRCMQRNPWRVVLILILLALAMFAPLLLSGYSEWSKASAAHTYTEVARHYKAAAQRIPWRADLYELSGHAYYYAKEYSQAEAVYQKAFQRNALSADGWVAWGDVLYLNGNPEGAARIWEDALKEPNPSEKLYSRLSQVYKEQRDYSRAAENLQKYVSLHRDDASAHYRLGLLLTLTDPNEALSEL